MGEMKMKDGNVLPSENSGAAAGTSENLTDGRTITRDKFEMVGKNIEIIPNTRPKEIAKHNARIPRSAEYGNAPANRSLTVRLGYLVEKPKFP